MRIYHGSTLAIDHPRIINRFTTLDFGTGFYTTSNRSQAEEFATKTFQRRGRVGIPTVSAYELDDALLASGALAVVRFKSADARWLRFVVHNRRFGRDPSLVADVIVGPVANDNVFRTIDMFEAGDLTEAEAIERFKVNELFDQYLFCNERALGALRYVTASEVM